MDAPFPPLRAALGSLLAVALLRPLLSLLYARFAPAGMAGYYAACVLQEIALFALPAYLVLDVRHPNSRASVRRGPLRVREAVSFFLAAALAVLPLAGLTGLWLLLLQALGVPADSAVAATPANGAELAVALLAMAVVPALCEEWFFRGMLFAALEPRHGTRGALLLSALAFALMHGSLSSLPVHLLLGLLLGALLVGTRSIAAPALYHGAHNAVTLVAGFLLARAAPDEASVQAALAFAPALLTLLFAMLLLFALLLALPLRARERAGGPYAPYRLPALGLPMAPDERALLAACALALAWPYARSLLGGMLP